MVQLSGEEYLTRREVQQILGRSEKTLIEWMNEGKPPKAYKLNGRIYYKKNEVDNLMQEVTNE